MARVAFIAHCLLNQNAKVEGGALRPAVWEPVLDALREHGYTIRQMPCPELAYAGARRFWGVREQFDTPLYRQHCSRLAKLVAAVMAQHVEAEDEVVLVGVDSSPTMGVDHTCSSPTWGGKPDIGDHDDSRLVEGDGIFIDELGAELAARGLPMPRATGITHQMPDHDAGAERGAVASLTEAGRGR